MLAGGHPLAIVIITAPFFDAVTHAFCAVPQGPLIVVTVQPVTQRPPRSLLWVIVFRFRFLFLKDVLVRDTAIPAAIVVFEPLIEAALETITWAAGKTIVLGSLAHVA